MPPQYSFLFPKGVQSDIWVQTQRTSEVGWADGRPRLRESSATLRSAVRVISEGGREGVVTLSSSDPHHLKTGFDQALALAQDSSVDAHRRIAEPSTSDFLPENDSTLFTGSPSDMLDRLKSAEKAMLARDSRLKKIVRLDWSVNNQLDVYQNSRGAAVEQMSTSATFLVEALSESAGETQTAWDARSVRLQNDLPLEEICSAVADQAVSLLGARPIPTGPTPLLLHPNVVCQLIELLSDALSADSVQLGKSFLGNYLGKPVASPLVTLEDNPQLPRGLSSVSFDDEAVPTSVVVPIESGVLKDYFYDLRTASKAKRESNGHGVKTALSQSPAPGASNLFIRPGASALADLLQAEKRMFYVWDVMGLHMADPITGEFSLGATGFLIQSGVRQHAVRGVTIAGRILDLLQSVQGVGRDLTWFGDRGSPHILISPTMVSGS